MATRRHFTEGDIVLIVDAPSLTGQIGVVQGEGDIWDYSVDVDGETWRFSPEQLRVLTLEQLIALVGTVPDLIVRVYKNGG